jgi:signal transduction histidine kinase
MARRLLYTHVVIRRRLSLQLALVMLLVALVPLAGAGILILNLIEASILRQVRASQEQRLASGSALIQNYLRSATTKLKSIAQMIRKGEDPIEQTRKFNAQTDPPDIFLEVGYWKVGKQEAELQAQAQQKDYTTAQVLNRSSNRNFNPKVKQQAYTWSNKDPILNEAANGHVWIAPTNDNVGDFNGLPISVPAVGGDVLTATLDLKPLSQILSSIAGSEERRIVLLDACGRTLAEAGPGAVPSPAIAERREVGHAGWVLDVSEPQERALAPLHQARDRALLGFGLASVMAVGLAFLFAGRVVGPVRSLARTADALGRGEFSVRTGIRREDEIGQLAQAFDRMASAVQQIDGLKSEFVSHVSHELRTPLTSAKVTLANVQEGLSGKESLGRVQEDLDRLIRMVNELLDVARIEAGITLARQRTDLGALVRSTAETLRPLAKVPLTVEGEGETLDLDAARVQQILLNLIDNALKYAKSRVDVVVRGREVRVTDDGPGVPPEHRDGIFEKFSKVETGPKPPGAGLGLSIARKLAQLHGGSLTCDGNTFVLRF